MDTCRRLLVALLVLGGSGMFGVHAAAQDAEVTQDGWWNQAAVSVVTTVPQNAIAVGAMSGAADKAAAVGISLAAPQGARLSRLTLSLGEFSSSPASMNQAQAAMLACPATAPWQAVKNGPWAQLPKHDCSFGSATGARDASDTSNVRWTFDLTAIGQAWLDGRLAENGIVISESVSGSTSFQVSLSDLASQRSTIVAEVESPATTTSAPATAAGAAPASTASTQPPPPTTAAPITKPPATTTRPLSLPGSAALPPATTSPATTQAPAAAPTTSAGAAVPELPVPAAGGFSWWVLVVVPLGLGLALVTSLVLGPGGEPSSILREGGVSRAIARRDAALDSETALEAR